MDCKNEYVGEGETYTIVAIKMDKKRLTQLSVFNGLEDGLILPYEAVDLLIDEFGYNIGDACKDVATFLNSIYYSRQTLCVLA
jgi:hypothetical protein